MAMVECDRCSRDYSTKLVKPGRYMVIERICTNNLCGHEGVYLCPECTRALEKFMEMEVELDGRNG